MTKMFRAGPGVDTDVRRCRACETPMVTRGHYSKMPHDDRGGYVPHGADGLCRSCDSRMRWPNRPKATKVKAPKAAKAPKPKRDPKLLSPAQVAAARRRSEESAYLREEWDHLRRFGVSPEEAAARLGISVRTIQKFVQEARAS